MDQLLAADSSGTDAGVLNHEPPTSMRTLRRGALVLCDRNR